MYICALLYSIEYHENWNTAVISSFLLSVVVRIDFETVWSSDMEMVMIMELCEMIQIPLKINFCSSSLFLRVELAKFTEIIPCVNDLSISLMRGPHIDFSFHIGSLAFTNLGLGHYNLANFGT